MSAWAGIPSLLVPAVLALLVAAAAWLSRRRDGPGRPMPLLWGVGASLGTAFTGAGVCAAGAAVVVTALLVLTGLDRSLQDLAQRADPLGSAVPRAVLRYGEGWTALVAVALVLGRRRPRGRLAAATAVQAVLAGLVVTLSLKVATGRRGPASPDATEPPPFPKGESAADFAFDAWNRVAGDGRFFWPSGHTLSSVALVAALAAAFPRMRWIGWVGYAVVAFVALAMVDGDFHWTSDVVAAVLLGVPLGTTMGRRLAAQHARRTEPADADQRSTIVSR
jgi:membrane-associated phospholipid phosphatase